MSRKAKVISFRKGDYAWVEEEVVDCLSCVSRDNAYLYLLFELGYDIDRVRVLRIDRGKLSWVMDIISQSEEKKVILRQDYKAEDARVLDKIDNLAWHHVNIYDEIYESEYKWLRKVSFIPPDVIMLSFNIDDDEADTRILRFENNGLKAKAIRLSSKSFMIGGEL